MKSKIYSSDILKSQLNRSGFIPVLLGVGYLLAFPVAELLMMGNWIHYGYTKEQVALLSENLYRDGLLITGMIVTVGAAFLIALWNFFYLYSRDKVDYYHSLPVNREHMFIRKLITGLICFLIPYLFMLLLAFAAAGVRGYFQGSMIPLALSMFVKHLIAWFFTYFCTVLILCMTGNVLMGMLSLGGFCLYGPVLSGVVSNLQDTFFRTIPAMDSGWNQVLLRLTPIMVFVSLTDAKWISWTSFSLLDCVLVTILFGVFAWFAFIKRPSESTGKSMVYGWFGEVIKFMIAIPSGLGVGLIFSVLEGEGSLLWWIFGLILGTVIVKGLIEVLYELDFKAFFHKKTELILSLVLAAAIVGICEADPLSVDTRMPSYGKITGIEMEPLASYITTCRMNEDGTIETSNLGKELISGSEGKLGRQTYDALSEIVKNGGIGPADGHASSLELTYRLKSGMRVFRFYKATPEQMQKLLQACFSESDLKEKNYSCLEIDEKYLTSVDACFADEHRVAYYGSGEKTKGSQTETAEELLRAFREDVAEATAEEMTENFPVAKLYFSFLDIPVKETPGRMIPGEKPKTSVSSEFYVYPTYHRTLAILEKTGYALTGAEVLEELQKDYDMKVYVRGYEPVSTGYTYYGSYLVAQEADREEIADRMVSEAFDVPWLRTIDVHIWMTRRDGDTEDGGIRYVLSSKDVPAYVQELMDKVKNGELDQAPTDGDVPDLAYYDYEY
ncbi:MAG: hypothetical protein IJW67_02425 [Blautia sp.]|nr:hypothetical protein [Blautia sp.]